MGRPSWGGRGEQSPLCPPCSTDVQAIVRHASKDCPAWRDIEELPGNLKCQNVVPDPSRMTGKQGVKNKGGRSKSSSTYPCKFTNELEGGKCKHAHNARNAFRSAKAANQHMRRAHSSWPGLEEAQYPESIHSSNSNNSSNSSNNSSNSSSSNDGGSSSSNNNSSSISSNDIEISPDSSGSISSSSRSSTRSKKVVEYAEADDDDAADDDDEYEAADDDAADSDDDYGGGGVDDDDDNVEGNFIGGEPAWEVEALLGERGTGIDQEYLVSWVPENGMLFAPSWEPAESVSMCAYAIEAYKNLF